MDARKPLAKAMESRIPKTIRYTPTEWEGVEEGAHQRGLEPAVFARMLTMYALSIAQAPVITEAAVGMPGQMLMGAPQVLRGARRGGRF